MFSLFGALALLVAAWGLYSVLAFDVATRRRELGIRSALGAGAMRILGMVLWRAVLLVGLGVAAGVGVAALAAPAVGPLLFTVSPWDPGVYLSVAATLLAVAVGAGIHPASRATRVDPKESLQAE
jgi:ABC-type antimicrobial peptide transport system permease subunit